jgi:hypothetical protein
MPRIPLVSESSMTDARRRVHQAMMHGPRHSAPVGPLAAAMHRPGAALQLQFCPRLREFVVLLVGRFRD